MTRTTLKIAVLGALAALVVLAGCEMEPRDFSRTEVIEDPTKGAVVLVFDGSEVPTRTIVPGFSMNAVQYEMVFDGPGTNDFTQYSDGAVYTNTALAVGDWTVKVRAYNAAVIAPATPDPATMVAAYLGDKDATFGFSIVAGSLITRSVTVVPIKGTGTVSLSLTWTTADVATPSTVAGSLVPGPGVDDANPTALAFTVTPGVPEAGKSRAAIAPATRGNGYYTLAVQLTANSKPAWGWVESLRVVTGQTTSKDWQLSTLTGGLELDPEPGMDTPFTVTMTPSATSLPATAGLVVSATPAGTGYSHKWYLDGVALADAAGVVTGTQTSTVNFPASSSKLTIGIHNLSVVVTQGNVLSSNTIQFTVTP